MMVTDKLDAVKIHNNNIHLKTVPTDIPGTVRIHPDNHWNKTRNDRSVQHKPDLLTTNLHPEINGRQRQNLVTRSTKYCPESIPEYQVQDKPPTVRVDKFVGNSPNVE